MINDFIKLAKYTGQRFDLMQGGGGNISLKNDDTHMWVTQAGVHFNLSETSEGHGYVNVDYPKIAEILTNSEVNGAASSRERRKITMALTKEATLDSQLMPSAEVYMHAMLPYRFGLHLHPIQCNLVTMQPSAAAYISATFPEALFVNYDTPGIDISLVYHQEATRYYQQRGVYPKLCFLKNHGLMLGAETIAELIDIIEHVVKTIESDFKADFSKYRFVTELSALVNQTASQEMICYLSEDRFIEHMIHEHRQLLFHKPVYPDHFIYNGIHPCALEQLSTASLTTFHHTYGYSARVILYRDQLFFVAKNTKAARDMEEVFKAHLMILLAQTESDYYHLNDKEIKSITF